MTETAKILEGTSCKVCNWPVIFACCNDNFLDGVEDEEDWDWWVYCSNKGCTHHVGEGKFQKGIDWVGDWDWWVYLGCDR